MKRRTPLFLLLLLTGLFHARAQTNTNTNTNNTTTVVSSKTSPVITINLDLNNFSDVLPFDVPFKMVGGASTDKIPVTQIKSAELCYKEQDATCWKHLYWKNKQASNMYCFDLPALKPNTTYIFQLSYNRMLSTAEQTTLTTLIQPIIQPELLKKAVNNDFDFIDAQIDAVITDIETAMGKQLLDDGMQSNFSALDAQKKRDLFQAVSIVVSAYDRAAKAKQSLSNTLDDMRRLDNQMMTMSQGYAARAAFPNQQQIVNQLQLVHNAIGNLYKTTPDNLLNDATAAKTYADNATAVATALDAVPSPSDAAFNALKQNIKDMAGSLNYKQIKYATEYTNEQASVTAQLTPFITTAASDLFSHLDLSGSSASTSFVTRSNTYVSADAGIAVLPGIAKITPYIGTNIYFRPINFDASLNGGTGSWFWKRASVVIGVSVASVARTNVRSDLFSGNFNLLTGIGFRMAGWIHFSAGGLLYEKNVPNPLNTNQKIAVTPYFALTFDLRIKTAINNLFSSAQLSSVSP